MSVFLTVSCMPVNEALKNNPHTRNNYVKNKDKTTTKTSPQKDKLKPQGSSGSVSDKEKGNKEDNIYVQSKNFLKKQSDKLSKYCIDWIGVPYVTGGISKKGTDCSGFVYNVYKDVYGIVLPRRSADMEKEVKILSSKTKLHRGDLVFFGKNSVNHVGIYLGGDNFIHASTSKGVIVSSLEEKYWKLNFKSCGHHGKVKQSY